MNRKVELAKWRKQKQLFTSRIREKRVSNVCGRREKPPSFRVTRLPVAVHKPRRCPGWCPAWLRRAGNRADRQDSVSHTLNTWTITSCWCRLQPDGASHGRILLLLGFLPSQSHWFPPCWFTLNWVCVWAVDETGWVENLSESEVAVRYCHEKWLPQGIMGENGV